VYSPSEVLIDMASMRDGTMHDVEKHLLSAIKRALRHDKDSQTFLFPINVNRNHWTLARAHYDKKERSMDIAYFDSYGGSVHSRNSEAHDTVSSIQKKLNDAIKAKFDPEYWPDEMTTIRNIETQQQDDDKNCGVFVCINMLRCIRGGIPNYEARNIVTEEDFVKVRCIIEEEKDKKDRREKAMLKDYDRPYIDTKNKGDHSDPVYLG
jgi:Ulp1 family protease